LSDIGKLAVVLPIVWSMGVKKGHGHFLKGCPRKIKRERRLPDGLRLPKSDGQLRRSQAEFTNGTLTGAMGRSIVAVTSKEEVVSPIRKAVDCSDPSTNIGSARR
jgi:hypothetical protein